MSDLPIILGGQNISEAYDYQYTIQLLKNRVDCMNDQMIAYAMKVGSVKQPSLKQMMSEKEND